MAPYYDLNFRKLNIITGYASSSFLFYILSRYPDLELNLIIGMAKKDGINRWDHERYVQISNENPKVNIYYRTSTPGVHTKIYYWEDEMSDDPIIFVGSANFSWNGFRDQIELLVVSNQPNIDEIFNFPQLNLVNCTDPNVEKMISFHNVKITMDPKDRTKIAIVEETKNSEERFARFGGRHYVELSLIIEKTNTIHQTGGLNWGQRKGSNPNEAYIPVPTPFNRDSPDFFPPLEQEFTLITDDGKYLMCVMAQAGRKAIHTSKNNSILGEYFRRRLDLPLGEKVQMPDLINYGRTNVKIYKIDPETYFMDFSIGKDGQQIND